MKVHSTLVALALLLSGAALRAAPGDQPVKPPAPSRPASPDLQPRAASLPAKGLFQGDHLTDGARRQLDELVHDADGMRVEVALLVPTGPWKIDEHGDHESDLTPARLQALRKYLAERGVDPKRIFVESRIDTKVKEPRLDVQILGRQAAD